MKKLKGAIDFAGYVLLCATASALSATVVGQQMSPSISADADRVPVASVCEKVKARSAELTDLLIVRDAASAARYEGQNTEQITGQVESAVQSGLLDLLRMRPELPTDGIVGFVRCVQSGKYYADWSQESNTPTVIKAKVRGCDVVAVAFFIYRGYAAVPDLRPYLLFFSQRDGVWSVAPAPVEALHGHTFYVHEMGQDANGMTIIAFGNAIGDTGVRMDVDVIRFDGEHVHLLWSKPQVPRAYASYLGGGRFRIEQEVVVDGKTAEIAEQYRLNGDKVTLDTAKQH